MFSYMADIVMAMNKKNIRHIIWYQSICIAAVHKSCMPGDD